jgi:hypothetical protein
MEMWTWYGFDDNFCLGKLRFDFLPFSIGFHDLSKVDEYDCHIRILYM